MHVIVFVDFADDDSTIAAASKPSKVSERDLSMMLGELDNSARTMKNYQLRKILLQGEKELIEYVAEISLSV